MTAAQVPLEMVRFDRVMEREYQFVRELVQNALDAGATEDDLLNDDPVPFYGRPSEVAAKTSGFWRPYWGRSNG